MHAWRRYVQDYLDLHRMKPDDLARRSGVSPQVLSNILTDTRDHLVQRPDQRTVELLADAMGVGPDVLLSKVGEAMGIPVSASVVIYDASGVSDEDLIRVLSDRLRKAGEGHDRPAANKRSRGSRDTVVRTRGKALDLSPGEPAQPPDPGRRGKPQGEQG